METYEKPTYHFSSVYKDIDANGNEILWNKPDLLHERGYRNSKDAADNKEETILTVDFGRATKIDALYLRKAPKKIDEKELKAD
jgi:hypothetical protein